MIQFRSILKPADNSGAKRLMVIGISPKIGKKATLGDVVLCVVRGADSAGVSDRLVSLIHVPQFGGRGRTRTCAGFRHRWHTAFTSCSRGSIRPVRLSGTLSIIPASPSAAQYRPWPSRRRSGPSGDDPGPSR